MTAAAKTKKPQGAATPQGSGLKLIQSKGKADMNSVSQVQNTAMSRAEHNSQIDRLSMLASQGEAIAIILSQEEVLEAMSKEVLQLAIHDLAAKFKDLEIGVEAL